jgi:hypothetical protein
MTISRAPLVPRWSRARGAASWRPGRDHAARVERLKEPCGRTVVRRTRRPLGSTISIVDPYPLVIYARGFGPVAEGHMLWCGTRGHGGDQLPVNRREHGDVRRVCRAHPYGLAARPRRDRALPTVAELVRSAGCASGRRYRDGRSCARSRPVRPRMRTRPTTRSVASSIADTVPAASLTSAPHRPA